MTEKHLSARWGALPNRPAIESQLIVGLHARAEYGDAAIDGKPAGADPLLRFAARCKADARKHLLQALAGTLRLSCRSRAARRRARPRFAARSRALLHRWSHRP